MSAIIERTLFNSGEPTQKFYLVYDDDDNCFDCYGTFTWSDHRDVMGDYYFARYGIELNDDKQSYTTYTRYIDKEYQHMNIETSHDTFEEAWHELPDVITMPDHFEEHEI